MIILIYGASHTGKTNVSQKLLKRISYPYLSIDHLKMGLIRSHNTALTVEDDGALMDYLWPIVVEIIKTAIENEQNLIVEGVYIPHNYKEYFEAEYLKDIKATCLIFSENYINTHYEDIVAHRNVVEKRLTDDSISKKQLLKENLENLEKSIAFKNDYYLIDETYKIELEQLYD